MTMAPNSAIYSVMLYLSLIALASSERMSYFVSLIIDMKLISYVKWTDNFVLNREHGIWIHRRNGAIPLGKLEP